MAAANAGLARARLSVGDTGPRHPAIRRYDDIRKIGDDSDGQYGLFVLWDSQENADAAASVIAPQLQSNLAGKVTEEPMRRLFSVIDS